VVSQLLPLSTCRELLGLPSKDTDLPGVTALQKKANRTLGCAESAVLGIQLPVLDHRIAHGSTREGQEECPEVERLYGED